MDLVRALLVREAPHDGGLNLVDPVRDFRVNFPHFLVERLVVGAKRLSTFIFAHGVVGDRLQFADPLDLDRLFLGSVETLLLSGIVVDRLRRLFCDWFGRGQRFPWFGFLLGRSTLDRLIELFGFG